MCPGAMCISACLARASFFFGHDIIEHAPESSIKREHTQAEQHIIAILYSLCSCVRE